MIYKIILTLFITLFFVSCSGDTQSIAEEKDTQVFNASDSDNDGLADKYETTLGLTVGDQDANSPFLDPLYPYQWHLKNSFTKSEDINIEPLWRETLGKKSVTVAVVDTGIDIQHSDIDVNLSGSYRYSDNSTDPSPTSAQLYQNSSGSAHGTACAGIVSSKAWNTTGGRGVAPNINLVGLNVFSNPTDATFASALLKEGVDVSSNSWGGGGANNLYDDQTSLEAIESGVHIMRNTKGIIYVFASGNDNANANFQSILSSGYVIPVSAVDENGVFEEYSDFGSNILVSAPGGSRRIESEPAIITTDLSGLKDGMDVYKNNWIIDGNENGDYTNTMNGTSASCPIVAGVASLMLSVNDTLTYRDVQYILALTARKNDIQNSSWEINGAGYSFSDKYGFGVIDAYKAVSKSRNFVTLGTEYNISKPFLIRDTIESQKEIVTDVTLENNVLVQSVQLQMKTDHNNNGKLKITLESPSGTKSTLAYGDTVLYDDYDPWTFLSFKFLDEASSGVWKLYIEDVGFGNSASILEASLTVKGYKR